jgi:hypothetical protein
MNTAARSPFAGYVGQKGSPETLVAIKKPRTHAQRCPLTCALCLRGYGGTGGQTHHYLMYLALYPSSMTQTYPVGEIGQCGPVGCTILVIQLTCVIWALGLDANVRSGPGAGTFTCGKPLLSHSLTGIPSRAIMGPRRSNQVKAADTVTQLPDGALQTTFQVPGK